MYYSADDMVRFGRESLTQAAEWPQWVAAERQFISQVRLDRELTRTSIDHASLLIQIDGINILTGPVYTE